MAKKIRIDEKTVKQVLRELEVASYQNIFDELDEQAGGTWDDPEYQEICQVMYRLEEAGEVEQVSSEGYFQHYVLTVQNTERIDDDD